MKIKTNTKGFTLIELLIVIAIIGILAVAFVPTLLDAPARGRDGQRLANINTIRTVLLDAELRSELKLNGDGADVIISGCVSDVLSDFITEFGGNIPTDPSGLGIPDGGCADGYHFEKNIDVGADGVVDYKFGLYAQVENVGSANMDCAASKTNFVQDLEEGADVVPCYAVLVQ